jgi:hypothetical protein
MREVRHSGKMTRILRWTCTNVRFSGFPSLHQNREKMLLSLLRAHPWSLLHLNPYHIYSLTHSLAVPLNLSPVVPLQLGSSWTWTWTWTRKIKIVANLGHNLCELVLTLSNKSVVESWKLYERTSAFKLISRGFERYKKARWFSFWCPPLDYRMNFSWKLKRPFSFS